MYVCRRRDAASLYVMTATFSSCICNCRERKLVALAFVFLFHRSLCCVRVSFAVVVATELVSCSLSFVVYS